MKMCDIWKFIFYKMLTCLVLFAGLPVTSENNFTGPITTTKEIVSGTTPTRPRRWSLGRSSPYTRGGGQQTEHCPPRPRPTQLTFDNYDQIIGNSTKEFIMKHLIPQCKKRNSITQFLGTMNGAINVNKGDDLYMAVYDACEHWAQTRINEIEQNGGFQIGNRFSNRTTLIVSNDTLIHIEKAIQGLLFKIEKRSCWLENFDRFDNGTIYHYSP